MNDGLILTGLDSTPRGQRMSCNCGWSTPWVKDPPKDFAWWKANQYEPKRLHLLNAHGIDVNNEFPNPTEGTE